MSSGLHSHRGTAWKQTGQFDRLAIVQGEVRHVPQADDYIFVTELELAEAPEVNEISLFRLPKAIDPAKPMPVEVSARRPACCRRGGRRRPFAVDYALPDAFRLAPPPAPEPLWHSIWASKHLRDRDRRRNAGCPHADPLRAGLDHRRPKLWRGASHRLPVVHACSFWAGA